MVRAPLVSTGLEALTILEFSRSVVDSALLRSWIDPAQTPALWYVEVCKPSRVSAVFQCDMQEDLPPLTARFVTPLRHCRNARLQRGRVHPRGS